MANIKIALLQLAPTASIAGNLTKAIEACRQARALGADLALFPELWQIGYNSSLMTNQYAIDHNSDFINSFKELATKLEMAIAITYLGKGANKPTNNIAIIDRKGEIILDYAKVHICDFAEGAEITLARGEEFKVASLKFNQEEVKIGAMICFDREFPESARTLMIKGAEIILTSNSCLLKTCDVLGDVRLAAFRARAFENMVGVAMTNYPSPKNDGSSCAYNADGRELLILGDQEEIAIAEFDIDFIRKWNAEEVWALKGMRPQAYK